MHPPQLRQRLTAALTASATLALTLALLAGLPYVLWQATGIPWPEHITSLGELGERLAQPVSDPLMIDLLAVVGWACWAAFTGTVIRETLWYASHLPQLLRDRHTHDEHLATLTVKGSLAALCIGTLVVALIGLWRPTVASAQQPLAVGESQPPFTHTAPHFPTDSRTSISSAEATAAAVAEAARPGIATALPGDERDDPDAPAVDVRHIDYTVTEGDTLWDIAQQHLGDALKWPRIYALNKDRIQDDGTRLTDPDLIRPGWHLTIPAAPTPPARPTPIPPKLIPPAPEPAPDATPSTPTTPKAPPTETPPTRPTPNQNTDDPRDTEDTGTDHHHGRDRTPTRPTAKDKPSSQTHDTRRGSASIGLGEAGLIGITAAAGLLAARRYWYWHSNRQHDPHQQTPPPTLSPLVDKAAQAAHAATRPRLPHDPDALITHRTPPRPPHTTDTVTIGERDGTEVPLDELALPGGCTWTGPGAEDAARALLIGILTASERQRPDTARVTAIAPEALTEHLLPGLPHQFTALTQTTDTAHAIQAAEQHLITHARTRDEQESTLAPHTLPGPPTTAPAHPTTPGTLLLLTTPDATHTGQLQALAARSHPATLIILALHTPLPGATTWHIALGGTTTHPDAHSWHPQHPTPLRLFNLTPEAGRDVTDVLLTAHGQHPRPHPRPTPHHTPPPTPTPPAATNPHTPPPAKHPEPQPPPQPQPQPEQDDDTPALPSPPPHPYTLDTPRTTQQTKPVRLHVLGPITLYARGHQDPIGTNLRSEVHEFLALLAAHPTGLLASDIADKLHLEPGTDQNALKNLRRAVRRALRSATGITAQEFVLLQGELHKLHPELVETDLADFSTSLKEAFPTPVSGKKDAQRDTFSAVQAALAHYRGPFAQGSDYLWADAIREHLAMKASDAALRLARQTERADAQPHERDAVLTLLEQLSTIHPDHERLAQHTIRLYQAAGRHEAARHTYSRLERHLTELGLEPEPATRALSGGRQRPPLKGDQGCPSGERSVGRPARTKSGYSS
ncbi:BTAD domain-containing putative transcriptional regulator [Actinomycetota bacterium Odt1-20B]